ncbi:MAG: hypothetical protein ABR903_07660 [Thermodesulfovibrionales bacterium]
MKKGRTRRDSNTHVEDSRYVAIDTELTGLNERRDGAFVPAWVFERFVPVLGRAGIKNAENIVKNSRHFKGGV